MGLKTSKEPKQNHDDSTADEGDEKRDELFPVQSSPSSGISRWPMPNYHVRQSSIRSRNLQPMPDIHELDALFAKVLASMDLPPDKAKLLKNYDNEKKWDIICDQGLVHAKDPPSHYLSKLRTYLDPKASRSHRKRKMVGESTSTQVLRDLEISLRTNHIEWVKEFLDNENQGLDALIDYLSFRLSMMRHEQRILDARTESDDLLSPKNNNLNNNNSNHINNSSNMTTISASTGSNETTNKLGVNAFFVRPGLSDMLDSPNIKRRSRHIAKLNMGATTDDIHICIMCLRAIMNNKYGFNMVLQHREAINCIALSLIHKSLRTKSLVLELLAAICLVKGGHEIILTSFDNFKKICGETKRFETLMDYFMNYEIFNIDFMVACMQFVNIVVHSVEDMNYRVHLQYEFTSLGSDDYLEKLRLTESEELHVQISAYLDNVFDVAALMEDSETKTSALERVNELEDELGRALDKIAETERESLIKLGELESELSCIRSERDDIIQKQLLVDEEMNTLKRVVKQQEQESKSRQSMLLELENLTKKLPKGTSLADVSNLIAKGKLNDMSTDITSSLPSVTSATAPISVQTNGINSTESSSACTSSAVKSSPPLQMEQPKPPPKPPSFGAFIPPPPIAGMMMNGGPGDAMTIKRKVQTKYKLPTLNWIALKPNQVRGTIFNELDEEKLHKLIDFVDFEERFKIGLSSGITNGNTEIDGLSSFPSKRFRKPENISLMEHTRLRNIAILRRKLDMPIDLAIKAIHNFDLKQLSLENVEILQKMVPTDVEIKAFREYVAEKKDVNLLTEEDKFVLPLTKIERLSPKLVIMSFIGNFFDNLHVISPQIYAIIAASTSVKNSKKFKALLEIILAFGNYLNSSKRGPAYGFKLQSLDTLLDTKSTDKRTCLLHYIVATVRQKFPELMNFDAELSYIDKAAQVPLENVIADINELDKHMESVRKEAEKCANNHLLKDFLNNSEDKLKKTKQDSKLAQDAFKDCLEYFGESSRNADATAFYSLLVRFVKAFKTADQENEQRRRLELAAASKKAVCDQVTLRTKDRQKKQQEEAVINELKSKTNSVREKKLMQQEDVYNGALEDILSDLKNEPYRRADAVRRSQRRRIDTNRLSRTMEELEF